MKRLLLSLFTFGLAFLGNSASQATIINKKFTGLNQALETRESNMNIEGLKASPQKTSSKILGSWDIFDANEEFEARIHIREILGSNSFGTVFIFDLFVEDEGELFIRNSNLVGYFRSNRFSFNVPSAHANLNYKFKLNKKKSFGFGFETFTTELSCSIFDPEEFSILCEFLDQDTTVINDAFILKAD